jgi:hypothetical protein
VSTPAAFPPTRAAPPSGAPASDCLHGFIGSARLAVPKPNQQRSASHATETIVATGIKESEQKAQDEIKALKAELVEQKKRNTSPAQEARSRKSITLSA